MPDARDTSLSQSPVIVGAAATARSSSGRATTWGEFAVCGLIVGFALYMALFAVLLADVLFLNSNLIIKPIRNGPPVVRKFVEVIYYPEAALLKFFRVIPG